MSKDDVRINENIHFVSCKKGIFKKKLVQGTISMGVDGCKWGGGGGVEFSHFFLMRRLPFIKQNIRDIMHTQKSIFNFATPKNIQIPYLDLKIKKIKKK